MKILRLLNYWLQLDANDGIAVLIVRFEELVVVTVKTFVFALILFQRIRTSQVLCIIV